MLRVYQANSTFFQKKFELEELLNYLPRSTHERARRYRFPADAFNFVLGRLMLKKGLKQLNLDQNLEQITFGKKEKPLLENVFFNISHSADLVVCVLSTEGEIGIDVEKEKPITLKDFQSWFKDKEWRHIQNSKAPLKTFYWYWVRKESILKALGIGLSYLHQVEINPANDFFLHKQKKWYLQDLDFGDGYFGAICSEVEIEEIKTNNFLQP